MPIYAPLWALLWIAQVAVGGSLVAGAGEGASLRSLGTLTAAVDGKEVPLDLVRHAVKVEIRDGVALTTVESLFRNETDRDVKGVFEYPLPQDAWVAGFGVWHGDRLVQGEVAERGRIWDAYQSLMVEWKQATGGGGPGEGSAVQGGRFQATVYPIPAQGQKRIRIAYMQVLGWNGHGFTYVYPLVSEETRTAGLEELSVHVEVQSQPAILGVKSLNQPAVVETTANSATVEYTGKGALPGRDFTLEIGVASQPGQLV